MAKSVQIPPLVLIISALAVCLVVLMVGVVGVLVGTTLATPTVETARVEAPSGQVAAPPASQSVTQPAVKTPSAPEPAPPPRSAPTPQRPSPPVPPPIAEGKPKPTVEPAGRYRVGDSFDQEVIVSRRSAFRVLGTEVSQGAQYSFTSSVVVTKVNADGSLAVEQRIRTAKLIDADPSTKAELAAALEKAQGTKFEIAVNAAGDVTELKGLKDPIRIQAGPNVMPGQSLRLWSLLDADAWKELAGLTFFQPDKPLKPGATWSRPAAHDWGPLGTWRGKTVYVVGKPVAKPLAERIDYAHDIYHRPPAAGADKGLPFRVLRPEFKAVQAGGSILYDPEMRRAKAAEETFRVRGGVVVSLAGTEAAIELEELQGFRLTITDRTRRELVGSPDAVPPRK